MTENDTEYSETDLFDYSKAIIRYKRRIGEFACFKEKAIENRRDRYADLNVQKMRQEGKLDPQETFVVKRVINNNISRDLSDAMLFINGAKRLAYFQCFDDPLQDCRQIESDFTKGLTYKGWFHTFKRHYDGASLHGWDAVEVMYDESKPLHVSFEHIGFDRLLFNTSIENIQNDEFLLIEEKASCLALNTFVRENGFDKEQVDLLLQNTKDTAKRDSEQFTIYKCYFKANSIVYICWFSDHMSNTRDYLKKPEPLKCGILKRLEQPQFPIGASGIAASSETSRSIDVDAISGTLQTTSNIPVISTPMGHFTEEYVTQYPIFLHIEANDEQKCIVDHKGKAFFDMPMQEAATALLTAYVNGMLKACNSYASVDSEDLEAVNRLEETTLAPGTILPAPVKFHHQDYPDSTCLNAMQYLDMENSQSSGKLAVAVSNRKDARKTAQELQFAQQDQNKITTASLAEYSDFLRELYSFAWLIVQSQALAGNIKFLRKAIQRPMLDGSVQTSFINDIEALSKEYDVRPAGDIDVIQVQEKLNQMMQDWPVIQSMPGLAQVFMEDFIRLRYPERADQYISAMKLGDPGKNIIMSLMALVQGATQPEELKAMSPQEQQQFQNILTQAQQYVQPKEEMA